MAGQRIEWSREGKCPICHKLFRSMECRHSFDYVQRVVNAANDGGGRDFDDDVERLRSAGCE